MTLEERLYEAYRKKRGIRLSANELEELIELDDAIMCRISNEATTQAGNEEYGDNLLGGVLVPWGQLVNSLRQG